MCTSEIWTFAAYGSGELEMGLLRVKITISATATSTRTAPTIMGVQFLLSSCAACPEPNGGSTTIGFFSASPINQNSTPQNDFRVNRHHDDLIWFYRAIIVASVILSRPERRKERGRAEGSRESIPRMQGHWLKANGSSPLI